VPGRLKVPAKARPAGLRAVRAAERDLDGLVALENKVFPGDRLSRRSFRYYLDTPTAIMRVLRIEGTVAGYSLTAFRKGSILARLYSIAVDPAFAGQGLGSQLLAACERDCRAQHCTALRLEVRIDNKPAIALYERRGYTRFDQVDDYYDDGTSALRFEKLL